MNTPHYQDPTVTLFHGDCLDVLRELPDASVDAVVTDPPYGLEFMGKEWDGPKLWREYVTDADKGYVSDGRTAPKFQTSRPSFSAGLPFQRWCEQWTTECLRVLKPGGHMLAFGGTRTWHRLAAAIEDAGFEIRDSIAWMYGSGFPKSLDVSKAIDKARKDDPDWRVVGQWLKQHREAAGYATRATFAPLVLDGHKNLESAAANISNWENGLSFPTWERWLSLKALLSLPADMDDEVWRLNGRKGKPGDNFEAREIVGSKQAGMGSGQTFGMLQSEGRNGEGPNVVDITAPATPEAERWQGWGTALKPAWEGVVTARKPLSPLATIGSHLDALEQTCRRLASDAGPSSAPTHHGSQEVMTATAPASAATPLEVDPVPLTATGEGGGSSAVTDTSPSESTVTTFSSTVTSWRACWAELCEATSTSTTGTTSRTTIDLTTLSSYLSKLTDVSTHPNAMSQPGWTSTASAVDNLFASAVFASRATLALSVTEPAIESTPTSLPAGVAPNLEPVVVARKPLAGTGTVAANVLTHGTGALNIDGCRIEGEVPSVPQPVYGVKGDGVTDFGSGVGRNGEMSAAPGGRWPANVILDESQAAALDQQSGMQRDGTAVRRNLAEGKRGTEIGFADPRQEDDRTYGGEGGASRFFYVAKADQSERVRVNGTAHPTVKPIALMRWLVRLVTPPGGTVLEPFAGSGTTVEACILEGFQCVAIEREADYLPLIVQRINRRRDPVAYYRAAGGTRVDSTTYSAGLKTRECLDCGSRGKPAGGEQSGKPWPTCGHENWHMAAPLPPSVTGDEDMGLFDLLDGGAA